MFSVDQMVNVRYNTDTHMGSTLRVSDLGEDPMWRTSECMFTWSFVLSWCGLSTCLKKMLALRTRLGTQALAILGPTQLY